MKELEVLLSKRWILKSRDKEMYYKLRDALGELRKFTTEKMGCQIIDNSLLIKMEKIPVIPNTLTAYTGRHILLLMKNIKCLYD